MSRNYYIGETNGNQTFDIKSHDLENGGLKLAGTLVTASAAELNILRWCHINRSRIESG